MIKARVVYKGRGEYSSTRRWWVYLGRWWVSIGLGPRLRSYTWGVEVTRGGPFPRLPSTFCVSGGPLIVSGLRRDYA